LTVDVFGQIISTENVEDAYVSLIELWIDTYLSEVERQNDLTVPTLARPASYQADFDPDNWVLAQLPGVVVVCPGTDGDLERQGNQQYGGWFRVGVAVIVSEQTEPMARTSAQRYQAAINALVTQHPDLQGFAQQTVLVSFDVELQAPQETRYVALATTTFKTWVDGIVTASSGPLLPDPDETSWNPDAPPGSPENPYTGYPETSAVDITLTDS
jgi:hypothetical protein